MYQEVTKGLEMDASGEVWEVSQAVEMGKDDAVGVQVWVINGNLSSSNTLTVYLEVSSDLENWLPHVDQKTIQEAPSITYIPAYSYPSDVRFRFVRLKYNVAAAAKVLFGASIQTLTWA